MEKTGAGMTVALSREGLKGIKNEVRQTDENTDSR